MIFLRILGDVVNGLLKYNLHNRSLKKDQRAGPFVIYIILELMLQLSYTCYRALMKLLSAQYIYSDSSLFAILLSFQE